MTLSTLFMSTKRFKLLSLILILYFNRVVVQSQVLTLRGVTSRAKRPWISLWIMTVTLWILQVCNLETVWNINVFFCISHHMIFVFINMTWSWITLKCLMKIMIFEYDKICFVFFSIQRWVKLTRALKLNARSGVWKSKVAQCLATDIGLIRKIQTANKSQIWGGSKQWFSDYDWYECVWLWVRMF